MRAKEVTELLKHCITHRMPVLLKGAPGIGKTDLAMQAVQELNEPAAAVKKAIQPGLAFRLITAHPAISDPTDYKGLPFAADGRADFLPFGELRDLMEASQPTVYFIDDLGQGTEAVQKALMQLILKREINGKKISDHVTFIAATNRREDKAGVAGILEPVKSRFATIIELEINTDDWVKWALEAGMPTELIAFIRFRPEMLFKHEPTRDIVNSPSPRTVANVGRLQLSGLPGGLENEVFAGAAGTGFAAEYCGFLKVYRELPSVDSIIMSPDSAEIPEQPATLYALSGALAARMNENTIESICRYLSRIPGEIQVACVKDGVTRNKNLWNCRALITWAADNSNIII